MRIHGSVSRLTALHELKLLGELIGYCHVSSILAIPQDGVLYRTVSRKQANMTSAKLRRVSKRGSITPEQVKQYKAKMFSEGQKDPYLELQSSSTGQKHRRYLLLGKLMEKAVAGEFDQFGLSKKDTIPWL